MILKDKVTAMPNEDVYIKDIGNVYCKNKKIKEKVNEIKIIHAKNEESYIYISGDQIIERVLDEINNVEISIIGGTDILLEIKEGEKDKPLLNFFKVLMVSLVLFFGAGIAIINFFEDVAMKESLEKIYYIITGIKKDNPIIVTIPFSIGIGFGIFVFFNRILSFSKRRRQEPGPLELELYLYDKNLEDNIISNLKKKDRS